MSKRFTISQLANAANVPTSTLRYYERIGLVEPEDRSQGNYRLYSEESLSKLKFIRAAQSIGFPLHDVRTLLDAGDAEPLPCEDVQVLIEDRLAEIEDQLNDLRDVKRVLKSALKKCIDTQDARCCHVIETLRGKSAD